MWNMSLINNKTIVIKRKRRNEKEEIKHPDSENEDDDSEDGSNEGDANGNNDVDKDEMLDGNDENDHHALLAYSKGRIKDRSIGKDDNHDNDKANKQKEKNKTDSVIDDDLSDGSETSSISADMPQNQPPPKSPPPSIPILTMPLPTPTKTTMSLHPPRVNHHVKGNYTCLYMITANNNKKRKRIFASNEQSMLNFRGEISEKSRWLKDPQIFENEDDDVIHEIAKVTAEEWNQQVDANILSAFACCNDETCNLDDGFASAINARAELSKFSSSIGSCNCTNSSEADDLFNMDVPITTNWDNYEESLEAMLTPAQISFVKAQMASAEAMRPKGVSALLLSKLWMVKEPLAEGAIEQNTQLCCQSADNSMSRQYTTNDRML